MEHTPGGMNGMSMKQQSNFMGFSIELSVANQYRKYPLPCCYDHDAHHFQWGEILLASLLSLSFYMQLCRQLVLLAGINVPFLNYLANLRVRTSSGPVVRVGGNSQEWTQLFLTMFSNQQIINKTIVPNVSMAHSTLCIYVPSPLCCRRLLPKSISILIFFT